MLDLSVFLFNKFGGTSQDVCKLKFQDKFAEDESAELELPSDKVTTLICDNSNYTDQTMSACARNYIVNIAQLELKQNKKHENKFIFRKLLNCVIDEDAWVANDTENILKLYKRRLEACKSK